MYSLHSHKALQTLISRSVVERVSASLLVSYDAV